MDTLSLIILIGIIVLSCLSKLNPGLLSLGAVWLLGYYGAHLSITQIAAGFPAYMFIVLVGVTYLFGIAKHNGTLEKLTQVAIGLIQGKALLAPVLFFLLAAALSTIGAGNTGAVALLAPVAMAIAWETGISAFFMTIALICGANAGTFSPFALTGIIANTLITKQNLTMDPWLQVYLPNLIAQTFLGVLCYALFYWRMKHGKRKTAPEPIKATQTDTAWSLHQKLTIAAIVILILSTVFLKTDVGFLSILLACALTFINIRDGHEVVKQIPWDVILMVCGVNMLIGMLETLGGLSLFTDLIAKVATPYTITAVIALITGIISAFSSSSGVVLPAFIPLVPQLIEKIGGGNATAIISSITVGAHLVDISPLSSLGALCIASAIHQDKEKLFRQLLGFGLAMAFAGAVICYVLFGWIK